MKGSKRDFNYDSPLGKLIMKLKKLATAIEVKKGQPRRRAKCGKHHGIQYGIAGWAYKRFRKTYCENIDGRLGFKCTTTIMDVEYQLEVDHIDENHDNNDIKNLQTLCACCHRLKTKYRREDNQEALNLMLEFIDKENK